MTAADVVAIRAAWDAGIPGDRRGPGRTVVEIAAAARITSGEAAITALDRMARAGELDCYVMTDTAQTQTRLYVRRTDVLTDPGQRRRWIRGEAAAVAAAERTGGQLCLAL